jgi:hypothetical protein
MVREMTLSVEIVLEDVDIMYMPAEGGPQGARSAFDRLESCLPSLKGRRFYGTFHRREYRACVALIEQDSPSEWGIQTWTIPGGPYEREKLNRWPERISEIARIFQRLSTKNRADPERPSIEYYRSQDELHLLIPIFKS